MPHLTAATTREYAMHGVTFTSYAASPAGATDLAAWRADFSPRTPGQPHTMTAEEVLHVLAGTLEVEVDDDAFRVEVGEAVLVPAGATFRVSNTSDQPARAWVVSRLGMRAAMADGQEVVPPWAQ